MYLRSLDMSGFKSFAGKTSIAFGDGITAVVGPNGSGKSNIFDAIRWVLGEQSAKTLRGAKMEDVIFAGSESRRSQGMAEVSVTLDNSSGRLPVPFGEVTISRRIYRSGESEYMLNKCACRHKDIQELLMDTGVGREAHAIIGQGKIDAILSTKAEERRAIFEDAAGVTKFRVRLQEAARKLEETELNLLRVHDIMLELDGQLGPLELAAEASRVYKAHAQTLRAAEVRLVGGRYVSRSEALRSHSDALATLREALAAEEGSLAANGARLETTRLELSELDQRIASLQTTVWELTSGLDKTQERLRANETLRKDISEALRRLEHEGTALAERLGLVEVEIADTLSRARELAAVEEETAACLSERDEVMSRSLEESRDQEDRLELMRAEVIELLSETAKKRNALKGLDVERELSGHRIAGLDESESRLSSSIEDESRAAQGAMEQRDIALVRLADTVGEIERFGEQAQVVAARAREHEAHEKAVSREIEARAIRHKVLADLANSYEGYGHGVRAVLTEFAKTPNGRGIVGTVADLLSVPKLYEHSIDTALGAAVQNIVSRDADTSRRAIDYLKQRKAGRATFLPLDLIRGGRIGQDESRRLTGVEGIVGVAVDLVQFPAEYMAVFEQLLGRVLIADDLEHAVRVSRQMGSKYRIVTLDGEVVNAGGSMTGGNDSRTQNSLLARKREMEDLATAEADLSSKLSEVLALKGQARGELDGLQETIAVLALSKGQYASALSDIDRDLSYRARERHRLEAELLAVRGDLSALRASTESLKARGDQLQLEVVVLERARAELEQEMAGAREDLRMGQSLRDGLATETMDLRVALASRRQLLEQCERDARRLEASRTEISGAAKETSERLQASRQRLQDLDRQRSEDFSFASLGVKDRTALELEADGLRGVREACASTALQLEESNRTVNRAAADLRARSHSAELIAARLEVEIGELSQQLTGVFGLSLDAFDGTAGLSQGEERAREAEIAQERAFLSGLGDVNLLAEEEFAKVKERRDFLFSQREDLVQAEDGLRRIIEETQETARARFMDTFGRVQVEFVNVFSRLFQGGDASLRLSEPSDVLGSGIEIQVRPPGKKLQNLTLLSGGERALAAIAVLFAVLKVRPNPFCVMDEIDAALDEVNVARFSELLQECARESQFIIVTHRKGTMRVSDRLYGVTMEDSGVSKVLSLDLQQATV